MSAFGFAIAILLIVVGVGAHRIYECFSAFLAEHFPGLQSRKLSFITVSVMVAAMLAPFLMPASLTVQISVWVLYLCFFAVGAWRIYTVGCIVARNLRNPATRD